MDKCQNQTALVCFIILSLGLISFTLTVAAEFNKPKERDIKLDGMLCYLPGSIAFRFGLAALTCLSLGQIIGNAFMCGKFCPGVRTRWKACSPSLASTLLTISWTSFGIALILMGGATSMSRKQTYGEGWLDGKCYIVRDGVYLGSATLSLLTITTIVASVIIQQKKSQDEQGKKTQTM
ncbi:DESIGUAL/Modifying wall lignin-1/2 [Dillenia turbinata]|uniref:DESIGUAL/Modifying wall lignin-1/2 n=1 Tax=Dillenia turbinata TaxID=194707 RepID=A0AAN8ZTS6_9MAGN